MGEDELTQLKGTFLFAHTIRTQKEITIELFTIHISVRLPNRSKVTQNKINFITNYTKWGLNSQPPDHPYHALPTEVSHYLVVSVND